MCSAKPLKSKDDNISAAWRDDVRLSVGKVPGYRPWQPSFKSEISAECHLKRAHAPTPDVLGNGYTGHPFDGRPRFHTTMRFTAPCAGAANWTLTTNPINRWRQGSRTLIWCQGASSVDFIQRRLQLTIIWLPVSLELSTVYRIKSLIYIFYHRRPLDRTTAVLQVGSTHQCF